MPGGDGAVTGADKETLAVYAARLAEYEGLDFSAIEESSLKRFLAGLPASTWTSLPNSVLR